MARPSPNGSDKSTALREAKKSMLALPGQLFHGTQILLASSDKP